MRETELLAWLHILGMAAYFGAQFALIYMLIPAAESSGDDRSRRKALITGLRFYNPFSIAALGVIVITGAIRLTDLKAAMRLDYFSRIGPTLSLKLGLAFLLIFIQTYLTFGLAFRIGRQEEVAAHGDGEPFSAAQIDSMLTRMRAMTWITILLVAAIVLVSIRMRAVIDADGVLHIQARAKPSALAQSFAITGSSLRLTRAR